MGTIPKRKAPLPTLLHDEDPERYALPRSISLTTKSKARLKLRIDTSVHAKSTSALARSASSRRFRSPRNAPPKRRSNRSWYRLVRRRMFQLVFSITAVTLAVLLFYDRWAACRAESYPTSPERLAERDHLQRGWPMSHGLRRNLGTASALVSVNPQRTHTSSAELGVRSDATHPHAPPRSWWMRVPGSRMQEDVQRAELKESSSPDWWRNADAVGPSPFDHVPIAWAGEKRRVMFLTDYHDYLERMNTHTYELVDPANRHPYLTVDIWGPGWAGYNSSQTLSLNVKRRAWRVDRLERAKWDWEIATRKYQEGRRVRQDEMRERRWWMWANVGQKPLEGVKIGEEGITGPGEWVLPEWVEDHGGDNCNERVKWEFAWTISDIFKQDHPLLDALDCGALLVQQIGDCHETRCLNEWYPYSNNITLSKYAFELVELFQYEKVKERWPAFEMGIFGHSP